MDLQESLKSEQKKFFSKEDGLYYQSEHIAFCNIRVVKAEEQYDLKTRSSSTTYFLRAIDGNGEESKLVPVKSFDKVSLFKLFKVPDITNSGKEQRLIRKKLELDAALLKTEKCICCHQGLQQYDGKVIWIMGDQIISVEQITVSVTIKDQYPFPDVCRFHQEGNLKIIQESIIKFLPGVSEILFYYSLSAIVKIVLREIDIDTNFTLAVIGPSGHLKTSMVKKIALWLSDRGEQQFNFSSYERTSRLLEAMDKLSGMNYLIDDFHAYTKTQDIERQDKRLDDIVRHIESNPDCANAIVTGEHIKGIFSCVDRMLVISIPRMNPDELMHLKEKMNLIPDNEMSRTAYLFARKLVEHLEEVKQDCLQFYQDKYTKVDYVADYSTRTYRHCCFIKLTEFLYCKYVCENSQKLSAHIELYQALERQYRIQQELLRKLSVAEQHDYILEVNNMLNAKEGKYIKIETDPDGYKPSEDNCLVSNEQLYITRGALIYGMSLYYGTSVDINKVIHALEYDGVLNRGTDSLTKKFRAIRHYVINIKLLKHYVDKKQIQDTEIFA